MLDSITEFLESVLKLKVNRNKSDVGRPWERTFLGYTLCRRKRNIRLRVSGKAVNRLKGDLKRLFRKGRGRSIRTTIKELAPKLRGWMNQALPKKLFDRIGLISLVDYNQRLKYLI